LSKARVRRFLIASGIFIVGCFAVGYLMSFNGGYHTDRLEGGRGIMFGALAAAHFWVLVVAAGFWFLRGERHLSLTLFWLAILTVIGTIDVQSYLQSVRGY
jgi:hypothetical protein